jgi:hypothetical protein
MEVLNSIVNGMNKEEVRHFKLWLQSTNSSDARKDVLLFDYMRKADEKYDEGHIFRKLYGKGDKNSFYRLKHRLQEDLGCNLALLHFDKNDSNNLYLNLSLFQIFVSRNKPELALYYLKRAEKKATKSENFEMLDIIYANFVRLSSDMPEINPEAYIDLRKENAVKLNQLRDADQVLAAVTYRLKLSQNYGKRDVGLLKMLDSTIKEFANDDSIKKSKSFQTRVFRAVSQVLIQKHNFEELEKYMLGIYKRFVEEHWFDKANHETKLQMLVYIINALFKNRKYRDSLDYAETLGEELSAFNNLLYDKYLFFYYNALVINYAQIDINRGLKALDELEQEMKGKKNSYYEFFIYLNKANLLFFQRKTNEAIRNLVKLNTNDHYKKADQSFKLKIAVAECIMHCESDEPEVTLKRVERVRKEFKVLLFGKDFKRELYVLSLIPKLCAVSDLQKESKLLKEIIRFVKLPVKPSVEDGEVLRYRSWLAPKVGISEAELNK